MSLAKKLPWVFKYRPKRIDDVVNQEEAKRLFVNWLNSWLQGKPEKKAVLLYGPPGSGKNSLVEAAAREKGLELVEMNASDYRRSTDIERIAIVSSRGGSLRSSRGRIIVLDEVDGISATADRGALESILSLIENTSHPVVLIANDPWDPKLRDLRDVCMMIEFKRLTKTDVKKVLRSICLSERLECEEEALSYIAEKAEGDLRSAINDLEAVGEGFGKVTLAAAKALLRARDRDLNVFDVVRKIMISKYAWQAREASTQTDLAPDELIKWIHENLPRQALDPDDLWRAYEALSRADVYFSRIIRTGNWDLLSYAVDMMTAGVALSIKNENYKYKWVKYAFPETVRLMAKTRETRQVREDLAKLIASHLKCSTSTAKSNVIPYLKVIFDNNPEYAARLALGLNLSEFMIRYLSESKGDTIIRQVERFRQEIRKTRTEDEATNAISKTRPSSKHTERKEVKPSKGLEGFFKK
ncbi:MAG: replication factor C large subunit [Sulfolobales archaeon]